jgi:bifunctional non-homologous end joining protein LigD
VIIAGVALTHPDRMVYPELGLTKQDLASYYAEVAPLMLRQITGRPLSLLRCPEGEGGQCFYQKHWTGNLPGIKTVLVKEDGGEKRPYAVATRGSDLVRLVQYGVMEFHTWQSRSDRIDSPDRVVLDLDPDPGVQWPRVREGAFALRAILSDLGLTSWVKTSGGKGLHVVVPIDRRATWEVVQAFARAVAERLAAETPNRYVTVASKAARKGRIFIDHLRNSRGATAVAPWSVRARKGAPVSVPIRWEELRTLKSGNAFAITDVRALLARRKADPWSDLPRARQSITLELARRLTD